MMLPHPRRALRTAVIGLTSLAVAGAGTVFLAGAASADPEDLDAVRARVTQVSDQVEELYHEAEVANERYLQAQEQHDAITKQLSSAEDAVARQTAKVTEMTRSMGGFAAAAYRQGVIDPTLQMVLSDNAQEALSQAAVVDAFAAHQSNALAVVAAERNTLAQRQANVEEQETALQAVQADLESEKKAIDENVSKAEGLLASLKAQEREILAEIEAERQAEAARQAAAARAARDDDRQPAGSQTSTSAPSPAPPPAPAASGRAGAAVAFALAQVGDPYVYGGTGPDGWDCSGLTSGAWRAAGVSIPRTSQAQFYGLPRVSLDALQPGDIIGYYSGVSHVGLYIGNGQIVHSSRPGRPVSVVSLYSMPVMGAVRPG